MTIVGMTSKILVTYHGKSLVVKEIRVLWLLVATESKRKWPLN